ncbi:MAG: class I SAM-dependent methyltransferase [Myxococcota bacterium]|nr:class I SAM-dependent methyltransferase [Myxococcota bacterium]
MNVTLPTLDTARAERFAGRMVEILNGGALALMTSIGHRAGLFDVMAQLDFATSRAIADEAGLVERYVREWLGAMVTGGIVEHDPEHGTYRLPREHAASLTRDARPGNLATTAQWIALLGSVEDRVLECFERGGGVPYSAYGRFHQVMAEESDQTVVSALVGSILPLVPGGIDALERGIDVLDVGCGSGRALNTMAAAFPRSRFVGYDLSSEAIVSARVEARERGLANASFEVRDVADLNDEARFDLVTAFDAIHDQARPGDVLAAVARALRPGGVFLIQEVRGTSHVHLDAAHPLAPLLYTVSCLHCMTVSLAAGGAGLGAMWGAETARRMLEAAGFRDLAMHELPHDGMSMYCVARR